MGEATVSKPRKQRLPGQGLGEDKTSPRLVAAQLRQADAARLRVAGMTYGQIARELGYANESAAYNAVKGALRRVTVPAVEELRLIEGERLDLAQQAIWERVLQGELEALRAFLKLSERRARLFGLDQQPTVNATLVDARSITIEYTTGGKPARAPAWADPVIIEGGASESQD